MKRVFRVLLIITLICSIGLTNVGSFGALGTNNENEDLALVQNEAIAQLDRLQEYFCDGKREINLYPDYKLTYPEWYAGAYLDDYRRAVVVVTDTSPEVINIIEHVTENNKITIQEGKNSFNKMLDAIRNLWEYEDCRYPFSYHLDEINNVVVVTIDEKIPEADKADTIASISIKAIETDVLVFTYGDVEVSPDLTTKPGSAITNSTVSVGGSAAYRAKHYTNFTWVYGFATAGHVVGQGHNVTQSGSTTVVGVGSTDVHSNPYSGGTVPQYLKSKLLDINFVQNNSGHSASNVIRDKTTSHASYNGTVYQNMTVYMTGRYNSSSGTVSTVSTTNTDFRDYAIASYSCQSGDSGGIVYGEHVAGDGHPVLGIHSGSSNGGWFCKSTNAADVFGIYPY